MYSYGSKLDSSRASKFAEPSDELRVAITFRRPNREPGLTKFAAPLSMASVERFLPDPLQMDSALYELGKLGFRLTRRGRLSASMRCSRRIYEQNFGTKLTKVELDPEVHYSFRSFYFPAQDAPWGPGSTLTDLIDDAYIQWPHIYMAGKRTPRRRSATEKKRGTRTRTPVLRRAAPALALPMVKPPMVNYFHLEMPFDVPSLLDAKKIHDAGTTGKGVRIAMVDSGFAHGSHPFFAAHGYTSAVDLAPNAVNDQTDLNGHGTGESTNIFAMAPDATFIGIKVDNDNDPRQGASMLEGFQTALQHRPNVISISMGYDLRDEATGKQISELPNNLAALEAEIQSAVAAGIVVVFSAGNGHFSFPGMMRDIISAGGVYVDKDGNMQASDYASSFDSKIYSGRHVPDFSGLVGMQPHAAYIMLPIPAGCEIDREVANPPDPPGDGTAVNDGWGVFSGTSAAAPQLAGVCALLLEKNPKLTPGDIKAILRSTARTVDKGHANPSSSDDRVGMPASTGDRGAAGAGLVDAFAAWQQV